MDISIPSLGFKGWLNDPYEKIDYIFSSFFLSEYSQTTVYTGQISSLPYLLHLHSLEPVRLKDTIEETLSKLFLRYFDDIQLEVRVKAIENTNAFDIQIQAVVINNGRRFSFGKAIKAENSKIKSIINLNN